MLVSFIFTLYLLGIGDWGLGLIPTPLSPIPSYLYLCSFNRLTPLLIIIKYYKKKIIKNIVYNNIS